MSMIVNIARNEFYSSIAALQNVTGKKGTIAILSNILMETSQNSIVLTATDLEIGIKAELPAEVLAPGSITIPSRKIFEIVRETDTEHIHIEVKENNWATITTEKGTYNLAGIDSDEYPSFPEFENSILSSVSAEILCDLIDKTIFSIAHEGESQFNLIGALVEKEVKEGDKNFIRLVSSDGHRLSLMEREIDTDVSRLDIQKTTLIPRKGIQEIRKFCENEEFIEMGVDSKQAVLKKDGSIMIIRLMNGDFPDYRNIIKSINMDKFININRNELSSSLKRINIFTEDLFNSVQFTFEDENLTLSSQNLDIGSGEEKINVAYTGEKMELGFNCKYFIEALQVMNSENVKTYLNSEKSPCLLESEDDPGFLSVIMPMKI